MRILSIDFGTVRIGTAISDELGIVAAPLVVIPNGADAHERVAALARSNGAERVVIGMPYALNGAESDMTRMTREFAERLRPLLPCPLVEWDEAFSSRKAGERMRSANVGRKRRRQKGETDTWAAAIILQEYLETLR
ncbi:MAG TPA: Holliday junction resolvase RuvX [Candidatus Kapabacteria bacterium]|nr:Holliday junction resolvase RuvX [Candidatus Kapabacteria bacterium]